MTPGKARLLRQLRTVAVVLSLLPGLATAQEGPGDRPESAAPLQPSATGAYTATGTLEENDTDFYLLEVTGDPQLWSLRAEVDGTADLAYHDGSARLVQQRRAGDGGAALSNLLLLPGRHYISLRGTDAHYTLQATPLGAPLPGGEIESNDDESRAQRLRFGETRQGTLDGGDRDLYRFSLHAQEYVRLEATPTSAGAFALRLDGQRIATPEEAQDFVLETMLFPGDHYLALEDGSGDYRLSLTPLGPLPGSAAEDADAAASAAPQLTVELSAGTEEVAAYWHEGQSFTASATIRNGGGQAAQVRLAAHASHPSWRPSLDREAFELAPGESRTVPVEVMVLPDARDDVPVRITVSASGAAYGALTVNAVCGAPPVSPGQYWPVPQSLLGGLNLAWSGLGGDVLEGTSSTLSLIDGLVAPSTGWTPRGSQSLTFALAAEAPIAGVLLNPYGSQPAALQLADFEVHASLDGSAFEPVLTGRLTPEPVEQAFVFGEPVRARFLRLTALSNQKGDGGVAALGEFKAVTVPTFDPFAGQGANVADPEAGGHVVWSRPLHAQGNVILLSDERAPTIRTGRDEHSAEWVVGFHHGRAAKLTGMAWDYGATDDRPRFDALEVAVSTESPVGPWRQAGVWQTAAESFTFDEETWARYVRFSALDIDGEREYVLPRSLRINEVQGGGPYLSILGEWGQNERAAVFELLERPETVALLREQDGNDTRETAQALQAGTLLEGQVVVGEDVDWYRLTVAPDDNHLEVRLTGLPTLSVSHELVDGDGNEVLTETTGSASEVLISAFVEPGDYFLRIEEPPRSVVFAWDNSGSMSPYLDVIYGTIAGFVGDVQPGREVAQLQAFVDQDDALLLEEWSGQPLELLMALNDYDRMAGSSDAERNLLTATRALGEREGSRAVMLMTDAESSGYRSTPALWEELERVRPRVFTFETSSAGSAATQDLMQAWASVSGGHYAYARSVSEFENGFARATCHLRRPARYLLEAGSTYQEPPGPGLVSAAWRPEAAAAVEIVLDLSGSMSRQLPSGATRVDVAKRVLSGLISDSLPDDTPFALRVFGHVRPNSCDTRLEVPLGPLDRARALARVADAQPMLLSGTPLAQSLSEVMVDLGGHVENANVILLTDGEESCGGDVEAAVRALRAAGAQVQLHIISFDVESAAAKEEFARLAGLGGGSFFDAADGDGLEEALGSALSPAFEIAASSGEIVAVGAVGGPAVSVPPGIYSLRLQGSTGAAQEVRVKGDDEQLVLLGSEGR